MPHEGAVHPGERRHVGHGGERHEIEQTHQVGSVHALRAKSAVGLDEQQEHHRRGAQMTEIAGFVDAVRVHHRACGRQCLGAQMMVDHHHVGPEGGGDGLVRLSAAIDADDQVVGFG